MAECPYINRDSIPDPAFNEPVNLDGYVFYRHNDGFGGITKVQFCKLIGRKRDVFGCLNENEWQRCTHYVMPREWDQAKSKPPQVLLISTIHTEECDGSCSTDTAECDNCRRTVPSCHISKGYAAGGLEAYACHVCSFEACTYCNAQEGK